MFVDKVLHAVLALLITPSVALDDQTLLQPFPAETLVNEIVVFKPVPNHHFNLKSKYNCGTGRLIKAEESSVQCQVTKAGSTQIELFLCDDQQSYCRREQITLNTPSPKGLKNWINYYWNSWVAKDRWQAPARTEKTQLTTARGFLTDFEQALSQAKSEDKLLMVYFTQASCPPCRMMKELTFATDEFQELAKKFVRLQWDVDLDILPEKIQPLKVFGTPTTIIFNNNFEEIDRRTGPFSNLKFKQWVANLDSKTTPYAQLTVEEFQKNLADVKSKNALNYEKLRLMYSEGHRMESSTYKELLEKFENTGIIEVDTYVRLQKAKGGKDPFGEIASIPYKSLRCEGMALEDIAEEMSSYAISVAQQKNESQLKKAMSELEEIQQFLAKPAGDPLQCNYVLQKVISAKRYIAKISDNTALEKLACSESVRNLDRFVRLPGVSETSQLEIEKAECSKDLPEKEKVYSQLKGQNDKDYSYDFWQASDALRDKNYDLALKKVEESLKIAKDRSWQKAFLLKMDILEAMGKKEDAKAEITQVLSDLQLPSSEWPKIHAFTQNLREKQTQLLK